MPTCQHGHNEAIATKQCAATNYAIVPRCNLANSTVKPGLLYTPKTQWLGEAQVYLSMLLSKARALKQRGAAPVPRELRAHRNAYAQYCHPWRLMQCNRHACRNNNNNNNPHANLDWPLMGW